MRPSLSKESVKTMTYQAQFKEVANNNNPESGLSISEKYSNTGLLVPLQRQHLCFRILYHKKAKK